MYSSMLAVLARETKIQSIMFMPLSSKEIFRCQSSVVAPLHVVFVYVSEPFGRRDIRHVQIAIEIDSVNPDFQIVDPLKFAIAMSVGEVASRTSKF